MLPEQLWRVIRQAWAVVVVIVVVCVVGFVGLAAKAQRPYHSSITLNVQAPPAIGNNPVNIAAVTFSVPTIQTRLTSQAMKAIIAKDTGNYAGSFTVAVSPTPASGVLAVTVSSVNPDLVVPALTSLYNHISTYPNEKGVQLPVAVIETQGPVPPVRDSASKKAALAALEGFVFGLALAVFAALGLARFRQYRDLTGRLERNQGVKTLVALPEPSEPGAGREDEFILLAADVRAEVLNRRASSFAVVSPKTGSTRSVVAAQLARGLAIAGHRVLLVDADLRAPRLEGALASIDASPTAPFTGMSWLPSETTSVPNLVVLRGMALPKVLDHLGMQGTGPVRLVAGSIAAIVGEARNANVILIVDCPSPEGAAEANAVLSAVDAALVVTSGALRRKDADRLAKLTDRISKLGTEVIGLVAGPKKDYNLRPVPTRSPV
ncbi:MAG: tyrosine-protein kinase [Frankiales bacterium]|nr:tyrosine-protein kinase [Frankiales bacterium]